MGRCTDWQPYMSQDLRKGVSGPKFQKLSEVALEYLEYHGIDLPPPLRQNIGFKTMCRKVEVWLSITADTQICTPAEAREKLRHLNNKSPLKHLKMALDTSNHTYGYWRNIPFQNLIYVV